MAKNWVNIRYGLISNFKTFQFISSLFGPRFASLWQRAEERRKEGGGSLITPRQGVGPVGNSIFAIKAQKKDGGRVGFCRRSPLYSRQSRRKEGPLFPSPKNPLRASTIAAYVYAWNGLKERKRKKNPIFSSFVYSSSLLPLWNHLESNVLEGKR